jgi:hypothetical protein
MKKLLKWGVFVLGIVLVVGFAYGLWVLTGAILCAQGVASECMP